MTVSDIQRYVLLGGYDPRVVDEGPWVTYADHVAAVAAVVTEEREAAARAMGLSTAYSASEALALLEAVAGIREASAHVISAEECDRRVDAAENDMALYAFNRALDKAREAVAALPAYEPFGETYEYVQRDVALDAIDGAGEAMSRTTTRPERHYRMESVMEPGVGYCRECQEAAAQRLKVVRDAADVALLGTLQTKEATWKRMSGSAPSVATPSCPVSGSATTSDST